jgi:hypothetical protein
MLVMRAIHWILIALGTFVSMISYFNKDTNGMILGFGIIASNGFYILDSKLDEITELLKTNGRKQ